MLTLDIVLPTKGNTLSLRMQLKILHYVLKLSTIYEFLKVNVIISVNDNSVGFSSLIERYSEFVFHFNNSNLGFDRNVFKGICYAKGDLIHILSDNDYRSLDYWILLFAELNSFGQTQCKNSELPIVFVPLASKLNSSTSSYPEWYALGIQALDAASKNNQLVHCNEYDHLLGTLLQVTSQISHVIVKRSSVVQNLVQTIILADDEDTLANTGLPQSIYLICLLNTELAVHNKVAIKPFLVPCLLAVVPEKHRSKWFYDSTFFGQVSLYKINDDRLQLPFALTEISDSIVNFLYDVGINLLIFDCAFHAQASIERWTGSLSKDQLVAKRLNITLFEKFYLRLRKNVGFFLKSLPLFSMRYVYILLEFYFFTGQRNEVKR